MTEGDKSLVSRIETASAAVSSFIASYQLILDYAGVHLNSIGKLYYSGRSRYRVEGITNGQKVITVSKEELSQTFFVDQKVVSQRNSIVDQSPLDLLHGLSDIRDVFASTDRNSLECLGEAAIDDRKVYVFKGSFPILTIPENIKVRMPIDVELFVDQANCLLLKRLWTLGNDEKLVDTKYRIEQINAPIEETLFMLDLSDPEIKKVETMDITKILFFSDDANQGASMN